MSDRGQSPVPEGFDRCMSEYAEAPEGDRRCILRRDHGSKPLSGLHMNRAGFAWDDVESAESGIRVIQELRAQDDRPSLAPDAAVLATAPRVVEHARVSGGNMQIRLSGPEIEELFPLREWIKVERRFGGKVYTRTVVVVEDWHEVTE